MSDKNQEIICSNCDSLLPENAEFCPSCGQKLLSHKDYSFHHMVIDSVGDYFHFDGKFLHSLIPLILYPGKMTSEYLQGKRARFIQPFKLVLFISVVYFIVVGRAIHKMDTPGSTSQHQDSAVHEINKLDFALTYNGRTMPADSIQKVIKEKGEDAFLHDLDSDANGFERFMGRQVINFAKYGPTDFLIKMVHNASKIIFILIPFVALLFKLLYIRKNRMYYDHLIFSIHFHAFLFLLLLIYQLIALWLFSVPIWIIMILIGFYLLLSMRRVYRQSWFLSGFKMISLMVLYVLVAMPVFVIMLMLFSVMI